MKRGEVWTVSGGPEHAGKPRPVVIVQDDAFDATNSITICGFTTSSTEASLFRVPVAPVPENGLNAVSAIMADKVTTVAKSKLGRRLGLLSPTEMSRLNEALLVFLGLAGPERRRRGAASR